MGSMTSCLNNTHSLNSNAGRNPSRLESSQASNEGRDGNYTIMVDPVGNETEVWHENHPEIEQIFISHGDKIYSLQFQYVENRNSKKLSEKHGGSSGDKFDVVKLKPNEYLTSIRGWRDKRFIKSIAFHTNFGKYGPFGEHSKYDKAFHMVVGENGQFGGFHGSAMNAGLTSIGVYVNAIPPLPANSATAVGANTSTTLVEDDKPTVDANSTTASSGAGITSIGVYVNAILPLLTNSATAAGANTSTTLVEDDKPTVDANSTTASSGATSTTTS